jgi:hypothetical protein
MIEDIGVVLRKVHNASCSFFKVRRKGSSEEGRGFTQELLVDFVCLDIWRCANVDGISFFLTKGIFMMCSVFLTRPGITVSTRC